MQPGIKMWVKYMPHKDLKISNRYKFDLIEIPASLVVCHSPAEEAA